MSILTPATTAGLSNPDRIQQWSLQYFYRTQSKTIFDESYTGTSMSKDGPRKSDTIVGAPILLINDLKSKSGMVVNYTMHEPLFNDSAARLNYAKVRGETREGSEKSGTKKFIKIPLAEAFWGVKEEDVFSGKKDVGMADVVTHMTTLLSDNVAQYMDDDAIETWLMGHSRHLYTTVAKGASAADDSQLSALSAAVTAYGIPALPEEHVNTLVWLGTSGLVAASTQAGTTFVDKVNTTLGQIGDTSVPGLNFLNAISLEIKKRKIVGSQYIDKGMNKTLVRVVVDPIVMTRIREDFVASGAGVGNILSAAYQTKGDEHPLIKQGSIIWGNLLVCEEERLLEQAFSNRNSFSAGQQEAGATSGMKVGLTDGNYYLEPSDRVVSIAAAPVGGGTKIYAAAATSGDATAAELDTVANVLVFGANSLLRVPGPVMPLIPRTTDDYRRIVGLGAAHIFAHKRPDFTDASGGALYNQSSLRICVYRG